MTVRGGWLSLDGRPIAWFADRLTDADLRVLKIDVGSPDGQQALECLSALAALRAWLGHWLRQRCSVSLRGDNITMLSMITDFGGLSPAVNLLTCETAILIALACYRPVGAEHAPGVANAVADALSRRFQPGKPWALPSFLVGTPETTLPLRDESWYLTVGSPSACSISALLGDVPQ